MRTLRLSLISVLLLPSLAHARTLPVSIGVSLTLAQLQANITGLLVGGIVIVCTVLFLCGAFLLVFSRGEQDQLQKGKDYMIKSLIGLAVVMASYGILRTVFFFLYW